MVMAAWNGCGPAVPGVDQDDAPAEAREIKRCCEPGRPSAGNQTVTIRRERGCRHGGEPTLADGRRSVASGHKTKPARHARRFSLATRFRASSVADAPNNRTAPGRVADHL